MKTALAIALLSLSLTAHAEVGILISCTPSMGGGNGTTWIGTYMFPGGVTIQQQFLNGCPNTLRM
jgi:hypothetical protein